VRRLDPARRRSAVVVTLLVVLVFLFAAWVVRRDSLSGVDRGARTLIREGRPSALETPMRVIGRLGSGDVLLPATLVVSAVLWRRRHRALALWLPAIAAGTSLALALMKWTINKPRPTLRGYGFPSGHVFGTTVFVLIGLYLLWTFDTPRRWQRAAAAAGIVFVTLVGYSRIYVNAHWLTDVVGGLLAGIAFALVMVLALDARLR
jgi:membrane-associated phospholipid phosphatase